MTDTYDGLTEADIERDMIASIAVYLDEWLESTPEGRASKKYILDRYTDPSRFTVTWHSGGRETSGAVGWNWTLPEAVHRAP